MRISIFGLGYVGAVTAGCLSSHGHYIVGVDVHPAKVEDFNRGVPPIVEPGLEELLKDAKAKGLLRATQNCAPLADLKKLVTANHDVLDVNGWADSTKLPAKYEGLCS
jgi:UDP-glucose 6-dehydrogenase